MLLVWNKNYRFDEFSIMYGYPPENSRMFIFNYFILFSKRHVFSTGKIEGKSPDIRFFLETLDKITVLRSIAYSKGKEVKFHTRYVLSP